MRVAVIGGTGGLGALVVAELAARGDAVRAVSRNAPPDGALPAGAEHARADVVSGEGLAAALDGVEAVLDAANASPRHGRLLVEGTRRLLAAGAEAGVGHHLLISIVGCDRVPNGYYDAKVAQERALAGGAVPWSVLRATQFHTLVDGLFRATARRRVLPRGRMLLQPVDAAVVARRLADALHGGPAGRLPAVAGPQVETLSALARAWRAQRGGALAPLPIPSVGRGFRAMAAGGLTDPRAAAGGPTFAQWLAAR
jgi:uncharacterized protein YbjT (DUF2867 family)